MEYSFFKDKKSSVEAFKKIFMFVLVIGMILSIVEVLSFLYFNSQKDKFSFYSDKMFCLRDDKIETLKKRFDRTLGWKNYHDTKFGERPREVEYDINFLASFGDSFTYCAEVKSDETWQTYLSRMVKGNVFNFGTGGWGTDQAYLRFTEDFSKVKTRIVTLGLLTENINRVANVYRAFYLPFTGTPTTKPYFTLSGDELIYHKNPIQNLSEISKLQDLNYLKAIGQSDYWYNHTEFPKLSFPYTKILFDTHIWKEVLLRLQHKTIDEISPPWTRNKNLWEGTEYEQIMYRLFDKFVVDAKRQNSVPIIMIFPLKDDAKYTFRYHKQTDDVTRIKNYCNKAGYFCFDGVDAIARNAKTSKELDSFYVGHLSPLGNLVIAKEFYGFLKTNKLL